MLAAPVDYGNAVNQAIPIWQRLRWRTRISRQFGVVIWLRLGWEGMAWHETAW